MTHDADQDLQKALRVALIGNPNTGKSTLFTALAGIPTRIGNYPGVTVEEKVGRFRYADRWIEELEMNGTLGSVGRFSG